MGGSSFVANVNEVVGQVRQADQSSHIHLNYPALMLRSRTRRRVALSDNDAMQMMPLGDYQRSSVEVVFREGHIGALSA